MLQKQRTNLKLDRSDKFKEIHRQNFDIRNPKKLKLELRNVFRLVVLILLDSSLILFSWHLANHRDILTMLSLDGSIVNLEVLFLTVLILGLSFFLLCGLYKRGAKSRRLTEGIKAIGLIYLALAPIALSLFGKHSLIQLSIAFISTEILVVGYRFAFFKVLSHIRDRHSSLKIKTALIGNQEDIEKCLSIFKKSKEFVVVTQLDLSKIDSCESVLSAIEQLNPRQIDEILLCSWKDIQNFPNIFWKLRCSGICWQVLQLDTHIYQHELEFSKLEGVTSIKVLTPMITGVDFLSKRIFDVVVSLFLLVFLAFPMLAVALLIKMDSSGSIFYRQTRVGLNGKHFKAWKFRTMVSNAGDLQKQLEAKNEVGGGILFKIKDDPRITRIGKYLRRFSIDELPQLFNVLRGEMSLVGPRPLTVRDVSKFSPEHHFRHQVLPGITGLWQVSGRSDTDSEQVFNLDFEYIQKWSLALDLEILLRTVGVVFNSKGAY